MAVQLQSAFNAALGSVKHVMFLVVGCCALTNLTMQRVSQVHQPQHRPAALWRVAALTVLTLRLASLAWHWATDRIATSHAQPAAPLSKPFMAIYSQKPHVGYLTYKRPTPDAWLFSSNQPSMLLLEV